MNAPTQSVTINGGMRMASWYDILSLGPAVKVDEAQVTRSTQRVLTVTDQEAALLGNDYSKVFIGGFSQGCCMSINTALLCKQTVGGVVGLSGHVFPAAHKLVEEDENGVFSDKKKNLRMFVYHGKGDEIIPYGKAAKTYEELKKIGFEKVQFLSEEYLGHSVSPMEMQKIREFLSSVMVV